MRYCIALCLILIASAAQAASDLVATYEYPGNTRVTIVTRSPEYVRMDTSPTSFMLLKDNKIWSVHKNESGQWVAMDMDQMKSMNSGGGFMSLFGGGEPEPEEPDPDYTVKFDNTGQREKIAGYTGTVYNIDVMENGNLVRRDEVVLGSHSDLKKINEAWMAISARMGEVMGEEVSKSVGKAAEQSKMMGYGGMLRYGDEMRLASVKKMNLNLSYYDLPAGVQIMDMSQMGQMPAQAPGQMPEQGGQPYPGQGSYPAPSGEQAPTDMSQPGTGGAPADLSQPQTPPSPSQTQSGTGIGQDAQDIGDAARDEAKTTTEQEVRDSVRNILNSLFD